MKILLTSDLHCEIRDTYWEDYLNESFGETTADVVVLAGDITDPCSEDTAAAIKWFSTRYPHVIWVPGNHEYYQTCWTIPEVLRTMRERAVALGNVHVLDNEVLVLDNQRFVGTTLWYAADLGPGGWSDFFDCKPPDAAVRKERNGVRYFGQEPRRMEKWIVAANIAAKRFLHGNVQEGDVVLTHMAPSYLSVHPRFAGDAYNIYFVSPLDDLIEEMKPRLWLHGHLHDSSDYVLGETRVVCNPGGYPKERPVAPVKIIDLELR